MDWTLACNTDDSCCLPPSALLSPDAQSICANQSSGDTVCDLTVNCVSKADVCSVYSAPNPCAAVSNCVWRQDQRNPLSPGYCMSVRDTCAGNTQDRAGCLSVPLCKVAPRCTTSSCQPDDACCLTNGAAACAATPGCATTGSCSAVYSE